MGDLILEPSGKRPPVFMYSTQASVVIVNPPGTLAAPRTWVISARFAPFPPRRSRISADPSSKPNTHCFAVGLDGEVDSTLIPNGQ